MVWKELSTVLVVAKCPVHRWPSSLFNFSPLYCDAIVGLRKKLYKPLQTSKRSWTACSSAIGASDNAHMVFPCLPSPVAVVELLHVCQTSLPLHHKPDLKPSAVVGVKTWFKSLTCLDRSSPRSSRATTVSLLSTQSRTEVFCNCNSSWLDDNILEEESSEEIQSFANMFEGSVKDDRRQELRLPFFQQFDRKLQEFRSADVYRAHLKAPNEETRMFIMTQAFSKKLTATSTVGFRPHHAWWLVIFF